MIILVVRLGSVANTRKDSIGKNAGGKNAGGKNVVGRAIIGAFITALLMKIFLLDFMITEGHSMVPAIKPGAILIVCKVFYGIKVPGSLKYLVHWRQPRKGDVVVFFTPLGEIAVKRCMDITDGNQFYAIGDNEAESYDSRNYGPVSNDSIIGKALGIK